jgi:hypothetical protein
VPERTVRQAFDVLLSRQTPTQSERDAAAGHRASVEAALTPLDIFGLWETGSFRHGTAVRGHSDVDVLVNLRGARPSDPDAALSRVKAALVARFPYTDIRVSRPAVVVNFAGGDERWEVIPAYFKGTVGSESVYEIPAPGGLWMDTSPVAHLRYVTDQNKSPAGGAKSLARLIKAWKYCNANSVKVSSFYLEMRAAKYMASETYFVADVDFEHLMRSLANSELAAMNDPTGVTGRFRATSTDGYRTQALGTLRADSQRVADALELEKAGKRTEAFAKLSTVFLGAFPSQYY